MYDKTDKLLEKHLLLILKQKTMDKIYNSELSILWKEKPLDLSQLSTKIINILKKLALQKSLKFQLMIIVSLKVNAILKLSNSISMT